MSISSNVSVVLEGGSLHDVQKGRAPGYRLQVQDTDRSFFLQPEYLTFLGEKGKDGSENGRELKERNAFLSFPPLP